MKQSTIIQAYKVLNELYKQKLPLAVGYKLWTLMQKLKPHWDFQSEKERGLLDMYSPQISTDGDLTFESQEAGKKFAAEYNALCSELSDLDVDLGDYKKIVLHLDDNLNLSMEDIAALSEFVDFTE